MKPTPIFKSKLFLCIAYMFILCGVTASSQNHSVLDKITHHYADNNGVAIHYVSMGEGPLVVFVHGFPDFWYTWRDQMEALSKTHRVVAIDLRGYNGSDAPKGSINYSYKYLIQDIKAVIDATVYTRASIVAHDWGAAISWRFASFHPEYVQKLVILSIGHPKAGNPKVVDNTTPKRPSYAEHFVSQEFFNNLNEHWFSGWVKDNEAKKLYRKAFLKSDKEAMIDYYRANFPLQQNRNDFLFIKRRNIPLPNIKSPVLVIHGAQDKYAATSFHNNTWNYIDNEFSLVVLPTAGHFIQQDESLKVTTLITQFLQDSN